MTVAREVPAEAGYEEGEGMGKAMTRRGFVSASAVSAGLLALAGCGSATTGGSAQQKGPKAPSAKSYPIEPDGKGVKAKWKSEKTRDGWVRVTNPDGCPELGVMDEAKIIQVDGYAFRDANGNGKLDLFEDWRQTTDARSKSLAASMGAEDCLKLMWHGGTSDGGTKPMGGDPNDMTLLGEGSRAGVSRLMSDVDSYASDVSWINEVQEKCEKSELGIPYLNSTDPYQLFDMPDPVAMAAAMDKDVWRKAGMWLGRAWRATGVRCLLGPQVDVYSNPIGCRLSGSVCEDPALNRDFTQAFAGGLQSTWDDDDATKDEGWGKDSVAAMLKHFVGEGCSEGGRNDHASTGAYNVFPGKNFDAHLVPFLDGGLHLDSKTEQMAAVMPCYGIAYSEDEEYGENVGSGYNKRNLAILRNAGWDGMLCTDWGILTSQTYGVANLSEPERYRKMVEAGIDQYGGGFDMKTADSAYELMEADLGKEGALARVRESARRITRLMMNVGLFEQPYSDRTEAKAALTSKAAKAFGIEASEKSIVMLKNANGAIKKGGPKGKPKAYVPQRLVTGSFMSTTPAHFEAGVPVDLLKDTFDVVTDEVAAKGTGTSVNMMTGEKIEGVFQESDCTRVDAKTLAECDYAIIRISGPKDPDDGVKGGSGFGMAEGKVEYMPVTLQYEPYTASTARDPSLAGDTLPDGTKENRSYRGKTQTASNHSDLDLVKSVREAMPKGKLIVIVDVTRPMVFSELEPYCDAILVAFNAMGAPANQAYANLVCGKTEPSGLLQFQMPKDMETVEASKEDVPRDLECYTDSEGNTYDFCFGLDWSGVISDKRVKKYSADPLTKPKTKVKPGKK